MTDRRGDAPARIDLLRARYSYNTFKFVARVTVRNLGKGGKLHIIEHADDGRAKNGDESITKFVITHHGCKVWFNREKVPCRHSGGFAWNITWDSAKNLVTLVDRDWTGFDWTYPNMSVRTWSTRGKRADHIKTARLRVR